MPPALSAEPAASFEALRDEWSHLDEGADGIFATWDWSSAWWRRHGAGRTLHLYALRLPDGTLGGVVPLYAWRERPFRVLRFVGHGPADELGPVLRSDLEAEAATALRLVLDGLSWSVFAAEQLPGARGLAARLGRGAWRREAAPVVDVPPGGWQQWLDERSANFRQQLRRRERALERRGATIRAATEETLERDLTSLFRLHGARWRGAPTAFQDDSFHRDVARAAAVRGRLRLWLLELEGRPIAAWHGFQVGSVCSYYQAGRDPSHDRDAPGTVLMAHALRTAMAEGAREVRLGRGDERYKYRLTTRDPGLETVLVSRGAAGRGLLAAATGARAAALGVRWARASLPRRGRAPARG